MWTFDRQSAEVALKTISRVALDGLTELKMGLTPSHVESAATDIEELVRRAQGTGLQVNLRMEKPVAGLSVETELEAYRVLQEALTNVLKHAPGASAEVTVRNAGSRIELVVANSTGHPKPIPAAGSGRGLRGMRERAEACGGRLEWSHLADGGFEVRAQFPALTMKA
jgi:signal transduction histidine kinase